MQPLQLGRLTVDVPVVLAPMAGVTNGPFRTLCRRFGGGLYVSEMVGARALVEAEKVAEKLAIPTEDSSELASIEGARRGALSSGRARTVMRASFTDDETPRSLQLYAVEPGELRDAVQLLADRDAVDHVDLNFGCPAAKVTRHGGGAALPWRLGLFHELVAAAVEAARGRFPVTVKMRKGIDADHLTYLDAGRAARDAGAAAVTLHGRTAHEAYAGAADWESISRLVETLPEIPVLGNGDIWEAVDAVAMMEQTGCAGVVIGRGCLGRPWLFGQLEAALQGRPVPASPNSGEVVRVIAEHGRLLADHLGEVVGLRELRKHTSWYLQGFEVGKQVRAALRRVETLVELDELLAAIPADMELPADAASLKRGHTHGPRPVRLPYGWLEEPRDARPLAAAAGAVVSGG